MNRNEFKGRRELARLIRAPPGFIGPDQPGPLFRFAGTNPQADFRPHLFVPTCDIPSWQEPSGSTTETSALLDEGRAAEQLRRSAVAMGKFAGRCLVQPGGCRGFVGLGNRLIAQPLRAAGARHPGKRIEFKDFAGEEPVLDVEREK